MDTCWEQAKARLPILFPNATLRGQIRGRLLALRLEDRLEYLEGEDEECKNHSRSIGPDVLRELEGVLDEVLSSTSEIILTNETDMISDLVDYMSTISELNIGEEEYRRRIEDLKLRLQEYENISNEVQDLQISIQDLAIKKLYLIVMYEF
ncbi:4360_t:CDS:2 [Paraglomus brasilianum]|uniref:4360_t:CDS:1 n=1 Tax=Paraglomus brasilianum TaxID=144538 RepID=A0A9N9A5Q3_9GLOM|nr:4360_t:CDS:2 [Paraglomus brasilianum]